jgi:hypothetical protein
MTAEMFKEIPPSVLAENGGGFGFVCIWQEGQPQPHARYSVTVEQWLSNPENQHGTWFIDGGWGGPPGAIHVRWNGSRWEYGGYCGRLFKSDLEGVRDDRTNQR